MKDILISDADGTIFKRMHGFRRIFVDILYKRYKIDKERSGEYYFNTGGVVITEQFKGILDKEKIDNNPEIINSLVQEFFLKAKDIEISLFEGVKSTLDELKKKNIKILITSGSKTDELISLFNKFDLPFDHVLGSDKIPKGHGHIKEFCRLLNLDLKDLQERAIYVGDGTIDMKVARNNKILVVGIVNIASAKMLKKFGANKIIKFFSEVKDFF